MKKQLEVGKTYPTRNGLGTGEVLCNDLSDIYPCGVKVTETETGIKSFHSYTMEGHIQIGSTIHGLNLIIPEPEPTYRAWNEDEVPVGAVIMNKKYKSRMTINSIVKNVAGYYVCDLGDGSRVGLDDIYDRYELLVDGKRQPCGVLE